MRMSASRRACVSDLYDKKRGAPGMGVLSWKQKWERLSLCRNWRRDACVDVICARGESSGWGRKDGKRYLFHSPSGTFAYPRGPSPAWMLRGVGARWRWGLV